MVLQQQWRILLSSPLCVKLFATFTVAGVLKLHLTGSTFHLVGSILDRNRQHVVAKDIRIVHQ